MSKIILMISCCVILSGCNLYSEFNDYMAEQRINKSCVYYHTDFEMLQDTKDIIDYIHTKIYYKSDGEFKDVWSTPEETLSRGYGDCEDFCILFINIYYVVFGLECSLVGIDHNDIRSVVEGGHADHMVIELTSGMVIDPQSGQVLKGIPIKYRYTFDEFFYY